MKLRLVVRDADESSATETRLVRLVVDDYDESYDRLCGAELSDWHRSTDVVVSLSRQPDRQPHRHRVRLDSAKLQ